MKPLPFFKDVILLWALRSPCNIECQYCYFGTLKDRDNIEPIVPGKLRHYAKNDVSLDTILDFIVTIKPNIVRRVFIAGGEPLAWEGTFQVVNLLQKVGCEIVINTNGLPLRNKKISTWLANSNIKAISVSLDSYDAKYNDSLRIDKTGLGWHGVVEGIRIFLEKRNESNGTMKVGVYSVITRENIEHIVKTAKLVAQIGVDYYIIQPISLANNHFLHDVLSLDNRHYNLLKKAIVNLKTSNLKIELPNDEYIELVLGTLTDSSKPIIKDCFGGRELFFISPDGKIWDCPSLYKISETEQEQYLSIIGQSAGQVFLSNRRNRNTDCLCFSQDCVNMWQLMAFDDIIRK